VKFKATDKANVEMGVYWDFKYAEEKAKDKLGVN
jgi:hypothetical protein